MSTHQNSGKDDGTLALPLRLLDGAIDLNPMEILDTNDDPWFSIPEKQILEAYDRLEQLTLEFSLLSAQKVVKVPPRKGLDDVLEQQIREAEQQVLEAKAANSIRRKVIESVLTTDPTLRAVHAGENASVVERKLAPLIARRDELSIAHTNLSKELTSTMAALTEAEVENIQTMKRNAELTGVMLRLIEETKSRAEEAIDDPQIRSRFEKLKEDTRISRMRWRIMKSVVSATVAGSGLNWAQDDELRELVVDDEEDDEDGLI